MDGWMEGREGGRERGRKGGREGEHRRRNRRVRGRNTQEGGKDPERQRWREGCEMRGHRQIIGPWRRPPAGRVTHHLCPRPCRARQRGSGPNKSKTVKNTQTILRLQHGNKHKHGINEEALNFLHPGAWRSDCCVHLGGPGSLKRRPGSACWDSVRHESLQREAGSTRWAANRTEPHCRCRVRDRRSQRNVSRIQLKK